ncbi:Pao retrotransposon peptidase family protein [Dirofilaria immitis]|nr:Pao retrotransposon peptidase family protein [Dirofilaria immitis]
MNIVITAQEDERNCTRFLCLNDIEKEVTDGNIKCYRFKKVPFGIILSPFLLAATLNYYLENFGSTLAWEIRRNLYIDNVTTSANNIEEARDKCEEMKIIFKEASMKIRESLSNDEEFNELIPYCDLSKTKTKNFLGLIWNCETDTICVKLKPWTGKTLTKRSPRLYGCIKDCLFCCCLYTKNKLIYAKSRIAPIKGVRAAQFALKQLEIKEHRVTVWSDSKCAFSGPNIIQDYTHKVNDEFEQAIIANLTKSKIQPIKQEMIKITNASRFSNWTTLVKATAKPFKLPLMPSLPESRVKRSRTFQQETMNRNANFLAEKGMVWRNTIPRAPCGL